MNFLFATKVRVQTHLALVAAEGVAAEVEDVV